MDCERLSRLCGARSGSPQLLRNCVRKPLRELIAGQNTNMDGPDEMDIDFKIFDDEFDDPLQERLWQRVQVSQARWGRVR